MKTRYKFLKRMGLRGIFKTIYNSILNTKSIDDIILHKNVITSIRGDINTEGTLIMGLSKPSASHPKLGKSKLTIEKEGQINVEADEGWAKIGPCSKIHVENTGSLTIGESYLNSECRIICEDSITIGDGCAISWGVEIIDSDRHSIMYGGEKKNGTAPIKIEDNVWIGNQVIIKKGVKIGEGAVIASGSVVTKDIPSESLAAGVPAEIKRRDIKWGSIKK